MNTLFFFIYTSMTIRFFVYTGAIAPNIPNVQQTVLGPFEATISWRISEIAYTQEVYNVEYGISENTLTLRSEVVYGNLNVSSTNLLYSVTLTELQPFTRYYIKVISSNSFISVETSIQSFQTFESGNTCIYVIKQILHFVWDVENTTK